MVTKAYEFEFDPYGDNPNNKITKERHTITPVGSGETNFFIPNKGPFHRRSFVLRNAATQLPLRPGYDYYFGFRFDQMILSGGMQPIYGAIVLGDPAANLVVEIDYQVVGGEFSLDLNQITTLLANKQLDPRTATWSAVVDIPDDLPAVPHRHNAGTDMVGMSEVVARMYDLIDAQEAGYNKALQSLLEHIADHANPHRITLSDLGIDELGSLVPATKDQAEGGTDNSRYMTALRTAEYCAANIVPLLNAHKNDTSNPHGTTKAQVGLGSVDNYATATNVEAQAGVATNRFMTPALTKAAIDVLAPLALKPHTDNFNNPHQTTKAQVGLGSVPNYAMATLAEAVAGTSTTTFMSPYLVTQAVSNGSGQGLAAHMLDTNNPHQVTKVQVGLGNVGNFAIATTQEAISGTATDKYMTPFLVAQALANGAGSDLGLHVSDTNNPHQVTADQVGLGLVQNYGVASQSDANSGSRNDLYMTPLRVAEAIASISGLALTTHVNDIANPHNTTKTQVGLGNVDNYATATGAEITALNSSTHFVTPANLAQFLTHQVRDAIALGADPVTKDTIGLGMVENFGVASEQDVINGAANKYMVPSTAGALLDSLLVDDMHLTANTAWITDISSRPPFEGILGRSFVVGPWTVDKLGLHTRGSGTPTPALVWNYTDTEYDTPPAALTFTGSFTMRAGIDVYLPLVQYEADDGTGNMEDNFMGIRVRSTGVTEIYLDDAGTLIDSKTEQAFSTASGTTVTYSVLLTRGVNYQITLKNGATQIFLGTFPLTNVLTETGKDLADLAYTFGFGLLTSSADVADVLFAPARWPNLYYQFSDVVNNKAYTYTLGAWTNKVGLEREVRKARLYYNDVTREVFMGLSSDRVMLMTSPTFGIVSSTEITATAGAGGVSLSLAGRCDGDLHVTGDLTVDGVTYIEVP